MMIASSAPGDGLWWVPFCRTRPGSLFVKLALFVGVTMNIYVLFYIMHTLINPSLLSPVILDCLQGSGYQKIFTVN